MDELTLLRRLDDRPAEPSEAALAAASARLAARIESTAASRRGRRNDAPTVRRLRRDGIIGLGLAAATCTAVLVFAAGPTPTASAQAATTLQAAASALRGGDTAPGTTRTHVLQLVSGSSGRVIDSEGELAADRGVAVEWTTVLSRAADGDAWQRTTSASTALQAWGPGKEALLRETRDDPGNVGFTARSDTDPNFWNGSTSLSPAQVRAMPRDPDALLRKFSGVTSPDSALEPDTNRVIDAASALLGSGLADADLQAATYRALSALPTLMVDPHATDLDGRPGVGIGALVSDGRQRIDLIIDPATGRFLGRTETNLTATDGAPAGNVEEASAVYTE